MKKKGTKDVSIIINHSEMISMKPVTKIALFVTTTLLAGTAAAATIDYRGEYKHEDEKYAHRIKIGANTKILDDQAKLSFGVEQKFQSSDQTDFWKEVVRGDSEFSWDVTYSLNDKWYIQPGMPITFAETKTTYKPQFRVGYKADFGLTTALRYRHELQTFETGTGTASAAGGGKVVRDGKTLQQGKVTLTGSYKFSDEAWKNLKLSYEANYNVNYDDVRLANDKNWEWDLGLKVGYQMGDFTPYMEFWSSDYGSSAENERQLKTRFGLKYSF